MKHLSISSFNWKPLSLVVWNMYICLIDGPNNDMYNDWDGLSVNTQISLQLTITMNELINW